MSSTIMTDNNVNKTEKDSDEDIPKMTYTVKNDPRQFNEYDAIFGQGGRANQYRNGTKFRQLVIQHSDAYSSIPSRDSAAKHKFVHQQVVDPLLAKGGRFFCLEQGKIKELSLTDKRDAKVMMTKIQQALRDERKRTRAHLRQKQEVAARSNPQSAAVAKVLKPGPYDTVFGLNSQAKAAREGSVYEKLITNLSDTYHAMDQQYNHHAPYTKYDFVREQVIKPLQQQGGRFFYVENGELVELKYHENTDCKVIMSRIQQAFDMEHKRKNPDALTVEDRELLRGMRIPTQSSYHQRTLPGTTSARTTTTPSTTIATVTPTTNNNNTRTTPMQVDSTTRTSYQFGNNFNSFNNHRAVVPSLNGISSNNTIHMNKPQPQPTPQVQTSHPVIGATDMAMQALRQALQPALRKPAQKTQRLPLPSQTQGNNNNNNSNNTNGVNNENNRSMATTANNINKINSTTPLPPQHDLGDDFDSVYTRHDTFFGPGLEQYHQKSVFCALVAQCCTAYNSIPSQDFRARQEFVFTQIMEPLLNNDGRFFVWQTGTGLKELDLYDEVDCRILLTNIQQAFFDDSKKRKRRGSLSPSPVVGAVGKTTQRQSPQQAAAMEQGNTEGQFDDDSDDDDGMFSDADEPEGTMQPMLGIDQESVHALFENLRDKIQLTI